MNSPAPIAPTSSSSGRLLRAGGFALSALTAIAIWLASLLFPLVPDTTLDSSWQLALNYGWTHDWVFGRDVVFTFGPWGWLTMAFFSAANFVGRMVWEVVWKALGAILIVRLAASLSWPRRIVLVAGALLLVPVFGDTLPFLVITGLILWSARAPRPQPAALTAIGALFGILALQKFTYLVLIGGGLAGVGVCFALQRQWRTLAWSVGSVIAGLVFWWHAAGQPLAALADFLQHCAWISSGYTEAMFVAAPDRVLGLGLLAALLYLVVVWDAPQWRDLPVRLALTFFGFISWKHGFVRADGHTLGFFSNLLFAGIAAPHLNPVKSLRRTLASWTLCVVAILGAVAATPGLMSVLHYLLRAHVVESTARLFSPLHYRDHLIQLTAAAAQTGDRDLPAVRAAVGDSTIDEFGYEQAILHFNHLNYHPRPVLQGYQCYSGPLAKLNEDFYLSARAPAFTLARLQTIDGRLCAFDDAALLPRLITDHDFVLAEKDFILLRHRPVPAPLARHALQAGRLRYGTETCRLPGDSTAIWARIDTPYSWLGWLRTIFYQPPEVSLIVTDRTGQEQRFRVVAPAARGGFLLSPLLLDNREFTQLVVRGAARPAQSFRVELPPGAAVFFLKRARYELFSLPDLTFKSAPAVP